MSHNKEIKLIVTDMDGTLLSNDKVIPSINIETVHKLHKKNIPVVLCTGRPHFMVHEYLRQLDISSQLISSNGGLVQDIKSNKTIFSSHLELKSLKTIIDFSLERNMDILLYDIDTVYFTEFSKRIEIFHAYNTLATKGGSPSVPCKKIIDNYTDITTGKKKISKILITELHGSDLESANSLLQTLPSVYAVPSMDIVIDVMNAETSKGIAVKKLAEYLNIPLENVLVIGDHKNDVSMLSTAGFSACMKNGDEEAKKVSQYITSKTNDEGGFSEAVGQFVNLNEE